MEINPVLRENLAKNNFKVNSLLKIHAEYSASMLIEAVKLCNSLLFNVNRADPKYINLSSVNTPRSSTDSSFQDFLVQLTYGSEQKTATAVLERLKNTGLLCDLKECLRQSKYTSKNFAEMDLDGQARPSLGRRDSLNLMFDPKLQHQAPNLLLSPSKNAAGIATRIGLTNYLSRSKKGLSIDSKASHSQTDNNVSRDSIFLK